MQFLTPTNLPLPPVLINTALKLSLPVPLCKPAADLTAVSFPSAPPKAALNQLFIRSTGTSILIAVRFVASGPKWSPITQKVFCSYLIFQFFLKSLQNSQTLEGLRFYSSLSALTEIIPFTMRNPVLEARRWHYLLTPAEPSGLYFPPSVTPLYSLYIQLQEDPLTHFMSNMLSQMLWVPLQGWSKLPILHKILCILFFRNISSGHHFCMEKQLNREKPQHWEWGGF